MKNIFEQAKEYINNKLDLWEGEDFYDIDDLIYIINMDLENDGIENEIAIEFLKAWKEDVEDFNRNLNVPFNNPYNDPGNFVLKMTEKAIEIILSKVIIEDNFILDEDTIPEIQKQINEIDNKRLYF